MIEVNKPQHRYFMPDNSTSLELRKKLIQDQDESKFIPEPYKKVAEGLEQQFNDYMLKELDSTSAYEQEEGNSSPGMNYYKSILNSERASAISKQGKYGIGIQEIILDQIYPKKMRNEIAFNHYQKQQEAFQLQRKVKINNQDSNDIEKSNHINKDVEIHQGGGK